MSRQIMQLSSGLPFFKGAVAVSVAALLAFAPGIEQKLLVGLGGGFGFGLAAFGLGVNALHTRGAAAHGQANRGALGFEP